MKRVETIFLVLLGGVCLLSGVALAQGHGHHGAGKHAEHDRDADRGDRDEPRGWERGKKKGWGDSDLPPGLAKKHRQHRDDDDDDREGGYRSDRVQLHQPPQPRVQVRTPAKPRVAVRTIKRSSTKRITVARRTTTRPKVQVVTRRRTSPKVQVVTKTAPKVQVNTK